MTELFLNYLRFERNRSMETVKRYSLALQSFETYFKNREKELDWASVDADLIRGWMESQLEAGHEAATVCTNLSAVKSLFRFALSRKLVKSDPAHQVQAPKKRKSLPQFVKESEMNELIDEISWSNKYKDVRARTIIILLYETGLRRSELVGLNDSDINFEAQQLKVTGKRNKQRIVPFGQELSETLQHYMAVRDDEVSKQSEALFLNNRGERISPKLVYRIVKENLSKVTTLKKRSPHVLRHSFATAMLNHEAGLESVRRLLGHESLQTTQIYTHTTFEQLRRVYKDAHPRG